MEDKKPKTLGGQINTGDNYNITKDLPGVISKEKGSQKDPLEEFEKLKTKFEGLKKEILKKYKFTRTISVMPKQASKIIEEDEGIPAEIAKNDPFYVLMIIPEEQYKNLPKIKPEVVKIAKETKENIWIIIKTEVDLWNNCLDSKFDSVDAISASFPIYDTGFLGALRVANIHKSLVLRKFEKYITSYVIGGSLVRGTADKTSDVDTVVIIDDTDVKRMPRLELLEKLRGIIYDYIREATALSGVKNILNVQVWLLTDFWQRVKDAEPVAFTFIRDGVPFYDRNTFIPWKLLLQMGKIKPSAEAIDVYVKQGDQTDGMVKRRLIDAMIDVYYGVVTPTQAMMMLAGESPPVPKEIVGEVKKILVEKEKVMTLKELKTLEKLVKLFKDYEHGTLKEVSGKEIDSLLKEWDEYNKFLKELRKKLEKQIQEKTAEEVYTNVFKLLKSVLGNKSQNELLKCFEEDLVKKGKIQPRFHTILKELSNLRSKLKAGKLNHKEVEKIKKDAIELIDSLVEYQQRAELMKDRSIIQVKFDKGNKKAEIVLLGKDNFIVEGSSIKKIVGEGVKEVSREEMDKAIKESRGVMKTDISCKVFDVLKKEFGDFEIVL